MNANTGKIIRIDLSCHSIEILGFPKAYYESYVGGSGLAAKIFWETADFNAAPLSPESMLMFMNGPLCRIEIVRYQPVLCGRAVYFDQRIFRFLLRGIFCPGIKICRV